MQISLIFLNTPSFLTFDVFEWSYARNKENLHFRKWANFSHPWNFPFFKDKIFKLFSYSYWSIVPKWKCAHNLLCKKYKNRLKLHNIAELQPPDWIQRKKNTLYNMRERKKLRVSGLMSWCTDWCGNIHFTVTSFLRDVSFTHSFLHEVTFIHELSCKKCIPFCINSP